jgi:hypothetical protein
MDLESTHREAGHLKLKAGAFLAGIAVTGALLAAPSGEAAERGAIPSNVVVTLAGTGSGTVTSSGATGPSEINCPGTCAATFSAGSDATLTATAAPGSAFAGFSGAAVASTCPGATNPCTFNVGGGLSDVTATFNLSTFDQAACDRAKAQVNKAKGKLRALRRLDASAGKIRQAEDRVKKAKKRKRRACAK